jgi:hypothetical protein
MNTQLNLLRLEDYAMRLEDYAMRLEDYAINWIAEEE